jgi:antitoxin component YwqK of YwqJK toxin-antitoxin module
MMYLLGFLFISSSVFSAEVCTYKGKSTWEGKTGLVKCTNFQGTPKREFQIKGGKQDGLQRSFYDGKIVGVAWFESPNYEPAMEITFDDYGNVATITCGKKAYTETDKKLCGFDGPYEISFNNFKSQLAKKVIYKDGVIISLETYFSSGKIKEKMKLEGNLKSTSIYHEDGSLSAESLEKDERPVWEKEYFTENRMKSESNFIPEGANLVLQRKKFYKNGKLQEEAQLSPAGSWSKEHYVGIVKRYHENGQLSSQENYDKRGDLEGLSTFFDNDGRVVRKKIFFQNKLIREEL